MPGASFFDKAHRTGHALPTGTPIALTNLPGVVASDLDGTYFSHGDYVVTVGGPDTYTLTATGSSTGKVAGLTITLNQAGDFFRAGI